MEKVLSRNNNFIDVLSHDEIIDFIEILNKKKEIKLLTLSGSKTGQLGSESIRELLEDNNRKSKITIMLGDPFSDAILNRYKYDEPDDYEAGIEGITRRLVKLHSIKLALSEEAKKKLEVRVFKNYPTISVIQADNDLYSSVYGYKLRGSDCPNVHTTLNSDYGRFLLNHFNKAYLSSIPLENWIAENQSAGKISLTSKP